MQSNNIHLRFLGKVKFYLPFALFIFAFSMARTQPLINVKSNAVFHVNSSAILDVNGSLDNESNNLTINGDVNISGSWNNDAVQSIPSGTITFDGSGDVQISGSGSTTQFNSIVINKDAKANVVQFLADDLTVANGFLTLTRGTFRFSGNLVFTNTFFTVANYVINANSVFWLDNANAIVSGQAGTATLAGGGLRISDGLFRVGTQDNNQHNLLYSGNGSQLFVEGGTLDITSRFSRDSDNTSSAEVNISGGEINIGTGANSSDATRGNFDLGAAASTLNWSGGEINLLRTSGSSNGDYLVLASNGTTTGGKLNVNAAIGALTFDINSTRPVWEFEQFLFNDPQVRLVGNNLNVLDDITLASNGTNRFMLNGRDLLVGGDFVNNLASADGFNAGSNRVTFNGSLNQNIAGTQDTRFYELALNKTNSTRVLLSNDNATRKTYVDQALRLLSANTLLDLNQRTLELAIPAKTYADNALDSSMVSFRNNNKYIINSDSAGVFGGIMRRRLPQINEFNLETAYNYPLGTVSENPGPINVFDPVTVIFNAQGALIKSAVLGPNAAISISPKPFEHPKVERNDVSLTLHYVIKSTDISYADRCVTLQGFFDNTEVEGNLGSYKVLYFAESYTEGPNGYWRIDPGKANNIIELDDLFFIAEELDDLDGDWTAGLEDAARAIYYSKADGNWDDPNTWSKTNFDINDGNTTIPNKQSDIVRIRNHTVTIPSTFTPAPANKISVEAGLASDSAGVLVIEGNQFISGDTLRLAAGTKLAIEHTAGISNAPSATGAVQTAVRIYDKDAIYQYQGSANQISGDGIPSPPDGGYVKKLIIKKAPGSSMELSKTILVNDTLSIHSGIFDLATHSANGNGGGKKIEMFGGEMIVRTAFPNNYATPTFTAGQITFDGNAPITIPSSGSTPSVNQYFDLAVKSTSRAGDVVFSQLGEIVINNEFTIDEQNFDVASREFDTRNSTVRFNGGNQTVPFIPQSPLDSAVHLRYYNLILDGSGTKTIAANANNSIIEGDLDIEAGVTLNLVGSDLELQGNWNNNGGTFVHNNNAVIFNSPDLGFTNYITSSDTTRNPFYKVQISGEGNIEPADLILIEEDLTIGDSKDHGNLILPTASPITMLLRGDMIVGNGADFEPGESKVIFASSSTQSATSDFANLEFYDLAIDITGGNNLEFSSATQTFGIQLHDNGSLELINGNIIASANDNHVLIPQTASLIRTNSTGHIDGELRQYVPSGDLTAYTFHVGHGNQYTPLVMDFDADGTDEGTSGILGVKADTINTTSSVISWDTYPPANISPAGSGMSTAFHIARQWRVSVPTGSSFEVGDDRQYDATFHFKSSDDFYASADYTVFEPRFWTGNNWIAPSGTGIPVIGLRTATTTQLTKIDSLGTFIVGEPAQLSFFSIANGNWDNPNTWSLVNYGGPASPGLTPNTAPTPPLIFVGDGYRVNLNVNQTVDDDGTVVGRVQLDSTGTLNLGTNLIQGSGEFRMMGSSTLEVKDVQGIWASVNNGSIRTTTRNFNFNNHNNGNFVYNGSANQNTGDGLPDTLATLKIDNPGRRVFLGTDIAINDSLHIAAGTFDMESGDIALDGNFRIDGSFDPDNQTFYFYGVNSDTISAGSFSFHNLSIRKTGILSKIYLDQSGLSVGIPKVLDITNDLTFETGNEAYIDAGNKINVEQRPGNYTNGNQPINVAIPDYARRWVVRMGPGSNGGTRTGKGHVSGELQRWVPTSNVGSMNSLNFVYHVGLDTSYTPIYMNYRYTVGNSGTAGYVAAQSFAPNHRNAARAYSWSSAMSLHFNVERFWRVSKPAGSTFNRGSREVGTAVQFVNPTDLRNGPLLGNFDLWINTDPIDSTNWVYVGSDQNPLDFPDENITLEYNIINEIGNFGTSQILEPNNNSTQLFDVITGENYLYTIKTWYALNDDTPRSYRATNTWRQDRAGTQPIPGSWGDDPDDYQDIAVIQDGSHVVLDGTSWQRGPTNVIIEDGGILEFEGNLSIPGLGFDLMEGGTLIITHSQGISISGNAGCVVTYPQRNFNKDDHNGARIIYRGDDPGQDMGTGLPDSLAYLELDFDGGANNDIELMTDVYVRDTLIIKNGNLQVTGDRTIDLGGVWINNSRNGAYQGNGTVVFSGSGDQNVEGSVATTNFDKIVIRKDTGNVILKQNRMRIAGSLTFETDGLIDIGDKTLEFWRNSSTPTSVNGDFSATRMIIFDSSRTNSGIIYKEWNSGASRDFMLPIGTKTTSGNEYSPMYMQVNNTSSNPTAEVKLVYDSEGHPDKPNDKTLKKYWQLNTTNWTADNLLRFYLTNNDYLDGDPVDFIPALYSPSTPAAGAWELDLGPSPNFAEADDPPYFEVTNAPVWDGDWTAGVPDVYFEGRVYYSIATGNWDTPSNWSTDDVLQHTGRPSSYFPGLLYDNDVAYVGINHQIDFNVDSLGLDTLNIRNNGTLFFNSDQISGEWKRLVVNKLLNIINNGRITGATGIGRKDTLNLRGDLTNTTLLNGPQLRNDANNYTVLKFTGPANATISGNGVWGAIKEIRLEKDALAAELVNTSTSLSVATTASPTDYIFYPERGTFRHNQAGVEFSLSGGDNPVVMGTSASLSVLAGILSSDHDIRYKTGSQINVSGANSILDIGYTLSRNITSSQLNLNINAGTVQVNTRNPQNSDINRTAFDLSNIGSSLSMNGGKIIIANGTPGANADFRYNAAGGTGMTGGAVIQSGDPLLTHSPATPIKFAGTSPVTVFNVVGDGANNVETKIASALFRITDAWNVSANNTINFASNIVELSGNLTNNGIFPGTSGTLRLKGGLSQNIINNTAPGLALFNLTLDKTGNNVNVQSSANSNILVKNTLEFAANNLSYINFLDKDANFIEVNNGGFASILPIGRGHVNGRLYRYFPLGASEKLFTVGNDDITEYRPALISFSTGSGGTAGLLGVRVYEAEHPDIANANVELDSDVNLYWNLEPKSLTLGGNRKMTITTTFLNPQDMTDPLIDVALFQHNIYSPAWPAVGSTWEFNTADAYTATSITTNDNTRFGDYVIAEPSGTEFWSYQSGNWNDPNTWSLTGYDTFDPPPPGRWPSKDAGNPSPSDIVYIGNNKRVVVPDGERPTVRFLNLENYNLKPGTLAISGFLGYVEGIALVMEDSCTVEMQHADGFLRGVTGGAIRMENSYAFGLGRFVYNRADGSQRTGVGIPDVIKTLVIDNRADAGSNKVFMSVKAGAPVFNIVDSLYIMNGNFVPDGSRINRISRDAVFLNNGALDRDVQEKNAIWEFDGTINNIYIGNQIGATFRDLRLLGTGEMNVRRNAGAANTAQMFIDSTLAFNGAKHIKLVSDRHLVIGNSAPSAISGAAVDRHVWTNLNSGTLMRRVAGNAARRTYAFPVGTDGDYLPASFLASAGGAYTSGFYGVAAATGTNTFVPDAHLRVNSIASDVLTKFWIIDTVTTTLPGQFTFQYEDPRDVFGDDLTFENVARWDDPREGNAGAWDTYDAILINPVANFFTTPDNFLAADFEGDWTAGVASAFRRIFYSRQNGLWSDPNSWTYNPTHSGPIYGVGIIPDQNKDSVIIGGDDEILLDASYAVQGISLGTSPANVGTLNTLQNVLAGDYFEINDRSTLKIGHPLGISALGNPTGSIQTILKRNYSETGLVNFVYNGTVDQITGDGLPASIGSLTINNTAPNGTVAFDVSTVVAGDFDIITGRADLRQFTVTGAPSGTLTINPNAYLRIGGANNMATAVPSFGSYNLDIASFVEFSSSAPDSQIIDQLPVNMNPAVSFGQVILLNDGTKYVNNPMLVRGNLYNTQNSLLENDASALSINGSIINSAAIYNLKIIEIGQ